MRSPAWVFWLYLCTTLPWAGCLLVYASQAPWRGADRRIRSTALALLVQYAALTAVLGFATFLRFFRPPYGVLVVLTFVLLSGVCVAGCWQLTNMIRIIREGHRDRTNA